MSNEKGPRPYHMSLTGLGRVQAKADEAIHRLKLNALEAQFVYQHELMHAFYDKLDPGTLDYLRAMTDEQVASICEDWIQNRRHLS